jgi:hypothetical protein
MENKAGFKEEYSCVTRYLILLISI